MNIAKYVMIGTRKLDFNIVEKLIRSKDYGIIGTIDPNGFPHSSSVLYGVSEPDENFCLYIISSKRHKKVKNLLLIPKASFVIPFPHYFLRFIPPNSIQFQGIIQMIDIGKAEVKQAFDKNRVLKMTYQNAIKNLQVSVCVKLSPKNVIHGYGFGMKLRDLRNNHSHGSFKSIVPKEKVGLQNSELNSKYVIN